MVSIDTLLFDLDGTLVDSAPDMADALDRTLVDMGFEPVGDEWIRRWLGAGSAQLVAHALEAALGAPPTRAENDAMLARYLEIYGAGICRRSRLYPGVREGLDRLRTDGYRLACVTNKPEALAARLLDLLDLGSDWLSLVIGGDTVAARKPDPLPLRHAMACLGASPEGTLMVGDSTFDVEAARAAGMGVVCVPYGYNRGADIRQAKPDAVVNDLTELHSLLRRAA